MKGGLPRDAIVALAALGAGYFLLAQDLSALNVAVPNIERDLDVDLSTVQWVVNAYLLVYGITIITGGRLADEIGRRRILLLGAAVFAATALLAAFAPNLTWLVAARALMGIGSGMILPSAVGIAFFLVPREKAALASGFMTGAYAVGMALGPIIGGALIGIFEWRATLLLDVLLALVLLVAVRRIIPVEKAAARRSKVDIPGIAALSLALLSLLVAIDLVNRWGWRDARILLGLAFSALFMAAFVVIERRAGPNALVPGDLIRLRPVSLACLLKLLFSPAYSVTLLYAPQVMRKLLGFTPFQSGLGLLPMLGGYAVVSFLLAAASSRVATRIGIIAGLGSMAVGTVFLSWVGFGSPYLMLVPGLLAFGIGLGLFQPAVQTEAVQADDRERKSLIAGLISMVQFVAGAVGLGLTTTIVASSERNAVDGQLANLGVALPVADRHALNRLLVGSESAQQVLGQLGAGADAVIDIAQRAFAAGVQTGFLLVACLITAAFVVALLALSRPRAR